MENLNFIESVDFQEGDMKHLIEDQWPSPTIRFFNKGIFELSKAISDMFLNKLRIRICHPESIWNFNFYKEHSGKLLVEFEMPGNVNSDILTQFYSIDLLGAISHLLYSFEDIYQYEKDEKRFNEAKKEFLDSLNNSEKYFNEALEKIQESKRIIKEFIPENLK